MAEYEACILGLEAAIDLRIKILEVYGESALVIYQIREEWETRHPNLIPYQKYVKTWLPYFDRITFSHIPRDENQLADALATLSSMFKVRWPNEAPSIKIERLKEPAYCIAVEEGETDKKPWFCDIKRYLETQEYLADVSITDKKYLRRLSAKFFLSGSTLYKRNHDMVLIWCVDQPESDLIIKEVHEGTFETHTCGNTMTKKVLRVGYYWLTMEYLSIQYACTCHKCQIYIDKIHVSSSPLNVMTTPWPSTMWGN